MKVIFVFVSSSTDKKGKSLSLDLENIKHVYVDTENGKWVVATNDGAVYDVSGCSSESNAYFAATLEDNSPMYYVFTRKNRVIKKFIVNGNACAIYYDGIPEASKPLEEVCASDLAKGYIDKNTKRVIGMYYLVPTVVEDEEDYIFDADDTVITFEKADPRFEKANPRFEKANPRFAGKWGVRKNPF